MPNDITAIIFNFGITLVVCLIIPIIVSVAVLRKKPISSGAIWGITLGNMILSAVIFGAINAAINGVFAVSAAPIIVWGLTGWVIMRDTNLKTAKRMNR